MAHSKLFKDHCPTSEAHIERLAIAIAAELTSFRTHKFRFGFPSSRCASTSHAQFFRAAFELFTDAIYRRQTQRTQFGVDTFGRLRIKVALEICHNFLRRAVFVKALDLGARGLLDVLEFLLLRLRAPLRLGV
jgi:hypothetical protein